MISLLCLACLAVWPAEPEPTPTKPRELSLSGGWTAAEDAPFAPRVIRSKAELEKAIDNKAVREEILKAVQFEQEYLVVFAWSGSGGDRVEMELVKRDKGTEVVFRRRLGLTDDLREHRKVFALPKALKHRVAE